MFRQPASIFFCYRIKHLLAILFLLSLLVSCHSIKQPHIQTKTAGIWFEDILMPLPFNEITYLKLVRETAATVLTEQSAKLKLPIALRRDEAPRILFLTVSDGSSPCLVTMGSGKGIFPALKDAISHVKSQPLGTSRPKWVKLDIVEGVFEEPNGFDRPIEYESSLYGFAFDRSAALAFLPEEATANSLVSKNRYIRQDKIIEYLENRRQKPSAYKGTVDLTDSRLLRFKTVSFFSDGQECMRLYRGHRWFRNLSTVDLLSAAIRAGDYLTRAVGANGRFVYNYHPKSDTIDPRYNMIRHAGTVYAMMELYEITGNEKLKDAAHRAIEYLLKSVRPCETDEGFAACVVEDGYIKLGANALSVVALAKYTEVTGDFSYLRLIRDLAAWISSVQDDSGKFTSHKETFEGHKVQDFTSSYYPGEALLAMIRLHRIDADNKWLDVAESGANYLIRVRDGALKDSELPHDHWLLYALNELHRPRPNSLYVHQTLRISKAILQSQNRNPEYPDWRGSFYKPPRSTPTATRMEGLYAGYQLTRDFGSLQDSRIILEGIQLGIQFQMQTQFRPELVLYLKNPAPALGGVRRSLTDFSIRIDYVQHFISSLLGLYRIYRTN
ncbi:MAG: hypothetical protein R6V46_13525 [Desulfatiglandaceae bacterium]